MSVQEITRKPQVQRRPQVAIMNAVHDLPVLAARDLGFFKDEGLDIEFITTPGMAQVTTNNGSHFTTLKMMEGFLEPKHLKVTSVGTMPQRLQALRDGKVAAVSLME